MDNARHPNGQRLGRAAIGGKDLADLANAHQGDAGMELYSRDFWNSRVVSLTGGADLVAALSASGFAPSDILRSVNMERQNAGLVSRIVGGRCGAYHARYRLIRQLLQRVRDHHCHRAIE